MQLTLSSQVPPFPAKSNIRAISPASPRPTEVPQTLSPTAVTICTAQTFHGSVGENLGSAFSEPLLRPGEGWGSRVAHPRSHSLSKHRDTESQKVQPRFSAGPSTTPSYCLSHILNQFPKFSTTHTPPQEPQTSQDSHKRLLGFAVWILPTAHSSDITF